MAATDGVESSPGTEVRIRVGSVVLEGNLVLPKGCELIVVFAHGSGSGRFSPRNVYVAEVLNQACLGTLLLDLLTREEDLAYENRFDINLLALRMKEATRWLMTQPGTINMKLGYFGASTGAAAAIQAASEPSLGIRAIVSRGGRPDLAWEYLDKTTAATLLIVGGLDEQVMELNREAYRLIRAEKDLIMIPGATHLFEERGKLEEVARLARDWFVNHARK